MLPSCCPGLANEVPALKVYANNAALSNVAGSPFVQRKQPQSAALDRPLAAGVPPIAITTTGAFR